MSKFIRNYSNNFLVINLLGDDKYIEKATNDIINIIKKKGLTHKTISLHPTLLSHQAHNEMPEWRIALQKEMQGTENIIINKIGYASCDEITDLTRSVRALSKQRNTYALFVEPNAISRRDTKCKNPYSLENCQQVNSIFPLDATDETKTKEFEIFLDSYTIKE
jgi:hypothetical protein